MKCQFCPKQIISLGSKKYWECSPCCVGYIVDSNDKVVARNHWITHRKIGYMIRVEMEYQQLTIGSPNLMAPHIILTTHYPQDTITPQNIQNKLKTYLTFL